jgi:lysophospholipase L1-like esterase
MSHRGKTLGILASLALLLACGSFARAADAPAAGQKPTLYIIGDSTVKNGSGKGADGLWGWGDPIAAYFDKSKINVANRALGGRSSRTYLTEGLWARVLANLKPGDFVLMQFGHNDGGPLTGPKARASIKGNGDETSDVTDPKTGKPETVHTYGWYMRKYVSDAKARGATPIVLSPIPRNMFKEGKVLRNSNDYGKWAAEAAKAEGVPFVDLNQIIANKYDEMGPEKVKGFFPGDHTHTNLAGARFNAAAVVEGLKSLKGCALCDDLAATPPTFDEQHR